MTNSQSDSLKLLRVIDRLVVGPVKVDRRRIVTPYIIHQGDSSNTFELAYRYEEDVFDPGDAASLNLAAMIGAQVAINYGLFCGEIVFHGQLDGDDRNFLRTMSENTAREIFVKKFLEPNPFLTGQVRNLPPIRRKNYLAARLVFPDASRGIVDLARWPANPSRVCVLSSGGKDSLLSHALLDELKQTVHPIYVNESGRHWFTALNAYRYFATHVPNTARVWTNSDRLFSWMLRHLPFVRSDFARLRADEYPIRLWTVAVFLFGTLPLLHKRGIGRIVVGDEFDTTDRRRHEGITHYNGLYDQSRYFDQRLTRYFQRKSWNLNQFSILRPLSEMLIEKVLVERYPKMQRLQVSCHAAHTEKNASDAPSAAGGVALASSTDSARQLADPPQAVRPCGECEKCTRIVGMLAGLGADPTSCGYSREQIDCALRNLSNRGVMLEHMALEHLAFLLDQQGLLPEARLGQVKAHERAEIMKLRFDPQRSPIDDVPVDLRHPLYSILWDHSAGAVRRVDDSWKDFDLLNDPALAEPD